MEDALNNATLLYTWTDVEEMEYPDILDLTLAQISFLIDTVDSDVDPADIEFEWRVYILNEWNRVNVTA